MESNSVKPSTTVDDSDIAQKTKAESSKKGKTYSDIWNFFNKITNHSDGVLRGECKGCKKPFLAGGKNGTSGMKRHKPKCPMMKFHDVGQMIIDNEGKVVHKKLDQKIARDLLASAVIKHDLPFSLVEYKGFREFVKYLNPEFSCISRNTLVSDIDKIFLREKDNLKQVLANTPNRICLTSDLWTACTSEGYISLTAHFVDVEWKLNSKILNFAHMPPPHSGVELAAKLFEFLKDWGIEKKVFSLTLDNASSNDNMQEILKEQLCFQNDGLLCEGEFFHIRCSAHILNLIVQEGLKVIGDALHKIRESVKYATGYESRVKKFEVCVIQVGGIDTSIGLRLDVPTRWNSTYLMLASAIKYKKAFSLLHLNDKNYKHCPSNDEWQRGEKICDFLEPFYDTTNLISGSSYPTSNLYFMQVWKIEVLLKKNLYNENEEISDMCKKMKVKFDKYWDEYSVVLAFGAILDPRMKLGMLDYFYSKVDNDKAETEKKILVVKGQLYKLFEEYSKDSMNCDHMSGSSQAPSSFVTSSSTEKKGIFNKGKRIFDECMEYESKTVIIAGKSQLDLYLEEPKLEFAFYEDLDVLEYWKSQKNRYPILARLACDVLAIPITTVASESSFSIGARVLTKYRSCILPKKVQSLICARNWLHGYDACETDDEANEIIKTSLSSEGSNVQVIDD